MSSLLLCLVFATHVVKPAPPHTECHDVCAKSHIEKTIEKRFDGEAWVKYPREEIVCDEWKSTCSK